MNKDIALRLALEAMEEIIHWYAVRDRNDVFLNFVDQNPEIQKTMKSITTIKEALETKDKPVAYINVEERKLEWATEFITWETPTVVNLPKIPLYTTPQSETKDEPVAWGMEKDGVIIDVICPAEHEREEGGYTVPLYTTPQQRTWVGLKDDDEIPWDGVDAMSFARAIEAKLKEKNNG